MDAWDEYDFRKDSDNDRPGRPQAHHSGLDAPLVSSETITVVIETRLVLLWARSVILPSTSFVLSLSLPGLPPFLPPSLPLSLPLSLSAPSDVFSASQMYIAYVLENQ